MGINIEQLSQSAQNIQPTQSQNFNKNAAKDLDKIYNLEKNGMNSFQRKQILDKCQRNIKERRTFKYGYFPILHYILCCVS